MTLIGEWKFDEASGNALDTSGFGNTAIVYGATRTSVPESGGNCFSFDGVNDYINIGYAPILNYNNHLTFSFWIKTDSTAAEQTIISRGSTTIPSHHTWAIALENGYIAFYWADGYTFGSNQKLLGTLKVNNNVWHKITVIVDDSYLYIYYDDTNPDSRLKVGTPASDETLETQIGNMTGYSSYYKGFIDNVSIYNEVIIPSPPPSTPPSNKYPLTITTKDSSGAQKTGIGIYIDGIFTATTQATISLAEGTRTISIDAAAHNYECISATMLLSNGTTIDAKPYNIGNCAWQGTWNPGVNAVTLDIIVASLGTPPPSTPPPSTPPPSTPPPSTPPPSTPPPSTPPPQGALPLTVFLTDNASNQLTGIPVYLDDIQMSGTPPHASDIGIGTHTIFVNGAAQNYECISATMTLSNGTIINAQSFNTGECRWRGTWDLPGVNAYILTVILQPLVTLGAVIITSSPTNAAIYVDGVKV